MLEMLSAQAVILIQHQAPASIRRHDFGGLEQAPRKYGLARARAAKEQHQRELGKLQGILGH